MASTASARPPESRGRCGSGEPSPGAEVAPLSPVPAQMWQQCAQSRCRCGTPTERHSIRPPTFTHRPSAPEPPPPALLPPPASADGSGAAVTSSRRRLSVPPCAATSPCRSAQNAVDLLCRTHSSQRTLFARTPPLPPPPPPPPTATGAGARAAEAQRARSAMTVGCETPKNHAASRAADAEAARARAGGRACGRGASPCGRNEGLCEYSRSRCAAVGTAGT